MRPAAGKMFLNMDMAFSAFLAEGPVTALIEAALGRPGRPTTIEEITKRGPLRKGDLDLITKKIKNIKVEVRHLKTKREFKVAGLSKDNAKNTKFTDEAGKTLSVAQYFADKYNRRLQFPDLPMIHVKKGKNDLYLPVELCFVVKGQRLSKKLTPTQTADMIKIAAQKPKDRLKCIEEGIAVMNSPKDPFAKGFGIKVSSQMTQVDARLLDAPKVLYAQNSREPQVSPQQGAWQQKNSYFFKGATLNTCAVLALDRPKFMDKRVITDFMQVMSKCSQEVGLNFKQNPNDIVINYEEDFRRIPDALMDVAREAKKVNGKLPDIIFVIMPRQDSTNYGAVKKTCETHIDILSQCMLGKHVQKKSPMYVKNILLKVNVKLGGINNTISKSPSFQFFMNQPAIIIGADVTHPNPGSKVPSIAAVVGSMDAMGYRYATSIRHQNSREEIIRDFAAMVKELLVSFYRATKQKPMKIIVYRDGVSEGQFLHVLEHEVTAIKQACASLEATYAPPVTFVVVQKRHHARFFVTNERDADRSGNIPAGTVVDQGIVHPREFDFYLCSHGGIQGTSRPTHYHVLYDEIKWSADMLQEFTYRLCYTYGRCTRSVSLVPAAYYAHLVAFRARFHTRESYDDWEAQSVASGDNSDIVELPFDTVKENTSKVMYFM